MTLLSTIYDYVETKRYPGVDYYLPLAFAAHESDFVPTAKGSAGEDGLFQFMEATAIEVMRQMNEPYVAGCANDVATSTRMWFAHYRYLCNLFVGHPEMHSFATLAYNRGYGRQLRASYLVKLTVEQHIESHIVEYNDYHYKIRRYHDKFKADLTFDEVEG
jgi:soluble lytic murein transglycosylase-like protein